MPEIRRLEMQDVKCYSNEKLVGDFEVASRTLFDHDATLAEMELKEKNITTLRDEMYHRMRHPRSL